MKKRILTVAMVIALLATCIGGATLAYLTDTEAKTNVFTVGNVDITLYESTLHRDNDGATDDQIIADAGNYDSYLATAGKDMVPGRWVKKAPYVQNTGKNACYVRVIVEQSEALWDTTSMMEYTTAQHEGAIVKSVPTQNAAGKWVIVYTYTQPLQPEEMTYYAPIWQFQIPTTLDNADLDNWAVGENVIVTAEAIQSEGFASYEAAWAAFDAQKNAQ